MTGTFVKRGSKENLRKPVAINLKRDISLSLFNYSISLGRINGKTLLIWNKMQQESDRRELQESTEDLSFPPPNV
jgi:hypothetical protein